MPLCEAVRRSLCGICTKVKPYVVYFHWASGSNMSLFLVAPRILIPVLAGAVMALGGFVLSVLGAIVHALVSLFLAPPIDELRPRVAQIILSRNTSTESLHSAALSRDSDLITQTTETVSSGQSNARDGHQSHSPPNARSSSQVAAGGPGALAVSQNPIRPQSPIRRVASDGMKRTLRMNTSPLHLQVALPSPLSPIPSVESPPPSGLQLPFAPSLPEPEASCSRHKVGRAASSPHTSTSQKRKWLPRRQNSTPPHRPKSLPRTDPYQAPYFFPTPASPDAADYVRQVRLSRSSAGNVGATTFEQRRVCEPGSSAGAADPSAELAVREQREVYEGTQSRSEAKSRPTRRVSWHVSSGSHSLPSSPRSSASFLRKSRSLLRGPDAFTPAALTSAMLTSAKERLQSGPSPDTREDLVSSSSKPRPVKRMSLLEKIHHRQSSSGDKAARDRSPLS